MESDPDLTRRLAFFVDVGKRKITGDYALLPTCVNMYALLDSNRTMELIQHLKPDVDITLLKPVKSPDLKLLVVYALCLKKHWMCIPSKGVLPVFSEISFGQASLRAGAYGFFFRRLRRHRA